MTIWIDPPRWPAHGRLWSHLVSDTSLQQLHDFAGRAGIPRRGFDGDHYDVPQGRYADLVALGARETSGADLARRLNSSGLRLRKLKGEKAIGRFVGVPIDGGATADIDLVASAQPSPQALTGAAAVIVQDLDGSVLVVHSVRRGTWDCPGGRREDGERVADCARREVIEETGLVLERTTLAYAGYERLTVGDPGHWASPRPYVQVFRSRLGLERPPLVVGADDVDGARWVGSQELSDLCGHLFWWPLALHLLSRDPGRAR